MSDKRQRLSKATWQALLAKHATSALSVSAFCTHESISPASFYQWRAKLSAATPRETEAKTPASPTLVDLGALGASRRVVALRLELGHGVVLTLEHG